MRDLNNLNKEHDKKLKKNKFIVSADHIEHLLSKEIEAEDIEQAKLKYEELWRNGIIEVNKSALTNIKIDLA